MTEQEYLKIQREQDEIIARAQETILDAKVYFVYKNSRFKVGDRVVFEGEKGIVRQVKFGMRWKVSGNVPCVKVVVAKITKAGKAHKTQDIHWEPINQDEIEHDS